MWYNILVKRTEKNAKVKRIKERNLSSMSTQSKKYITGLRDGIPIGLGYLSVSFTFGIMAASYGIPFGYTLLISMTNLTSAGQLAGIGIIHSGGSLAEMALTQLVINLRYALMSLSLSQKLDNEFNLFHRLAVSFGVTDEIFALAISQPDDISPTYMYGLITVPYIGWASGTALGALAGSLLPDILRNALGIALYGMFVAIVVPPAKKRPRLLAVIGISVAMSCIIRFVPIFSFISDGFSIIICTIVAAAIGALLFPIPSAEATEDEND